MSGKDKGFRRWLLAAPQLDGSLWPSEAGPASPKPRVVPGQSDAASGCVPCVNYRPKHKVEPFTSADREFFLSKLPVAEKHADGIASGLRVLSIGGALANSGRSHAAVAGSLVHRGLMRGEPDGNGGATLFITTAGLWALREMFTMGSQNWVKLFPRIAAGLKALSCEATAEVASPEVRCNNRKKSH